MIIHNVDQRSPEWFALRCGVPTASEFDKIITSKGEPSKQREKYLYKLAGEKITGRTEEAYQNQAMLNGCLMEDEAREFYSLVSEVDVVQVGFCMSENITAGASPDGLVGEGGVLEIKCPTISTQIGYLLAGGLPTDYFQQVQGQLFVTGRVWCDFLSYFPGLKPLLIRVDRDEKFIRKLEFELMLFCEELKNIVIKIGD